MRSSRTGTRSGPGPSSLKDKTNLARAGLNPAHDPRLGKNSSTLDARCSVTVRKADIEESTSAVDATSLALQSSYPGGNFSVAAIAVLSRAHSGSQASLSARCGLVPPPRQESVRPHTLRAGSLAAALSLGRLGYSFQGLPPQRNSPSAVLDGCPVHASSNLVVGDGLHRQRRADTPWEVSHWRVRASHP